MDGLDQDTSVPTPSWPQLPWLGPSTPTSTHCQECGAEGLHLQGKSQALGQGRLG